MKVKLIRHSMNPVEQESLDRFMDEYRLRYDAILDNVGGDMKTVHAQVEEMIAELAAKYEPERELEVELPRTGKKWQELLGKYGVVSIGTHVDTGKLCLIIMDNADSGLAF